MSSSVKPEALYGCVVVQTGLRTYVVINPGEIEYNPLDSRPPKEYALFPHLCVNAVQEVGGVPAFQEQVRGAISLLERQLGDEMSMELLAAALAGNPAYQVFPGRGAAFFSFLPSIADIPRMIEDARQRSRN